MIARANRKRSQATFAAQVEHVLDGLYDFACTLVPPPEADDLTQVACLRALEHWADFRPGTSFRTWVFTILKNEFLTRYRRERRWAVLQVDLTVPLGADGVGDDLEALLIEHQWNTQVHAALQALPEGFRVPVYLKDVAGFAYREIAEIADCPLGTVMSRLARGRALLRAALVKQARERGLLRDTQKRAVQ